MKLLNRIVLGLIGTCILLLAALPTLLSTQWGKDLALGLVNRSLPGKIQVESLHLSWFGGNSVRGLQLLDPEGAEVAGIEFVKADTSLFRLLLGSPSISNADLEGMRLHLKQQSGRGNNLNESVGRALFLPDLPAGMVLKLENVQARLKQKGTNSELLLSGKTERAGKPGNFELNALLEGYDGTKLSKEVKASIQGKIQDFPVLFLDGAVAMKYPGLSGVATSLMGNLLNLTIDQELSGDDVLFLLRTASDNVNLSANLMLQGDRIVLKNPVEFAWAASLPESWGNSRGVQGKLLIEQFDLPIRFLLGLPSSTPSIQASYHLASSQQAKSPYGIVSFNKMDASIKAVEGVPDIAFRLSSDITVQQQPVTFSLTGALPVPQEGVEFGEGLQIQIAGDALPVSILDLAFNADGYFSELLGKKLSFSGQFEWGKELVLALSSENITIPKLVNIFENDGVHGKIQMDEAVIRHGKETTRIRNLTLPWHYDVDKYSADFSAQIEGGESGATGYLSGNLFGHIGEESPPHTQLYLDGTDIPVQILEPFAKTLELRPLLGNRIDTRIESKLTHGEKLEGVLHVSLKGQDLEADLSFLINDSIQLNPQGTAPELRLTVTPERYLAFRKFLRGENAPPERIHLLRPFQLKAKITSLQFPNVPSDATVAFWDSSLSGKLSIKELHVSDTERGQEMEFQNITANIESPNLAKKIQFTINGKQRSSTFQNGEVSLEGELLNSFSPNGKFNEDQLSLQLNASAEQFPAALFCRLLIPDPAFGDKLEALLGEKIQIQSQIAIREMQGPVALNLNGPNGSLILDAQVKNGTLTLNKPLSAKVNATPQLSREILLGMIPFLSELIQADSPLTFEISPDSFSFPLKNFDLNQIQIGLGTIQLGRLSFKNEGDLRNILSLLKAKSSNQISLWFTPLYFRLEGGVLQIGRMDILAADAYPIATWGTVDLKKDKVNMVLGISGAALNQALGSSKIPADYYLQIPLKGSLAKTHIDRKLASTRIGSILAKSEFGTEGLVVGTLLDLANGKEGKVPPPTTQPFPWKTDESAPSKDASPPKNSETMRQLEKGAKSLLKKILK